MKTIQHSPEILGWFNLELDLMGELADSPVPGKLHTPRQFFAMFAESTWPDTIGRLRDMARALFAVRKETGLRLYDLAHRLSKEAKFYL